MRLENAVRLQEDVRRTIKYLLVYFEIRRRIAMSKWQRFRYQPCLPLGKDGRRVTGSPSHVDLSRKAASEGMVLLKNEGTALPLRKGERVALFGKGSADYVKGGGGSGDVTCAYVRNLCDGMRLKEKEGKVRVFGKLSEFYEQNVRKQLEAGAEPGMTVEPELPEALLQEAREHADTAIITICRFSGEGWDRRTIVNKNDPYRLDPTEQRMFDLSAKIFPDGDFYLTEDEKELVRRVTALFPKVIAVLNVGGMVDSEWFRNDDRIQGALLAWQGGMEGGLAMADVLTGDVNPSGHLTDTFAKELDDYPSTAGFHKSTAYVDYEEDIYVGYRYFETIPGKKERVNYPFGYGLSYSEFVMMPTFASYTEEEGGRILLSVKATNVSQIPGKAVVQVYAQIPQGKLGKPSRTLVAFGKTALLGSGEAQQLDLTFPISRMASYDDTGKVQKSAWLLEAGTYRFYVGNDVRDNSRIPYEWTLDQTRILEQESPKCVPHRLSRRMLADGSFEALQTDEEERPETELDSPVPKGTLPAPTEDRNVRQRSFLEQLDPHLGGHRILLDDVADGSHTLDEFMDQLTLDELIHLLGGQPNRGVANTFGFGNLEQYGVPDVMTADGPAGVRFWPQCGVNTTAFPCATALACTWDTELIAQVGEAAALEAKENNIGVWLAPAINIHRSPLCGRNFEYWSEDPLVAGRCAGALVHGVQSQKIGTSLKHFCCNNKETNRKNSDSRVSERALREIYLKGFELIVKHEQPYTIMTSYNKMNGIHTSENQELLTGILRGEWGYQGMVTTDWWTNGEHYLEAKAGNDLKMGAGFPERVREAYDRGLISKDEIRADARRILATILKFE